jgi:Rhs element Vgr protein
MSGANNKLNTLGDCSIKVNGKDVSEHYNIESLYLLKEINKIAYCRLAVYEPGSFSTEFSVSNSGDFDPGNSVEIRLGYGNKTKLAFKGVITGHGLKLTNNKSLLTVEARDEAIKLTSGRKNNIFEKRKDSDIINSILKSYSLNAKVEATTIEHPEVVQHYCSDWDFIIMRSEINGQLITTNDGKVEVKAPDVSATEVATITCGQGVSNFSVNLDAKSQYQSVVSSAWDPKNQKLVQSTSQSATEVNTETIKTSKLSEIIGGKEYILQSAINMPSDILETWAKAKHTKSVLSKIKGKIEIRGNAQIEPGTLVKLSGFSKILNGKAFVGGVEHSIEGGFWKTTVKLGTEFEWYTEETPLIDPPSTSGITAPMKGLATGVVKQLDEDPDGQYRIKVALPTLQKDNLAVWARMANYYATSEAGNFFYPEIGDEVLVGFLNEDPQHPIILGSLYSSKIKAPFTPEKENKIKAIVTKSKMTISFDDTDKIIEIKTPGANSIVISDKEESITITDQNKNTITLSKDGVSIETEKDFSVKAKGKINLEATSDVIVKATGDFKGEGLNVSMEGKTKFAAKGAMAEVNGSGQTTIKGGIVMIN